MEGGPVTAINAHLINALGNQRGLNGVNGVNGTHLDEEVRGMEMLRLMMWLMGGVMMLLMALR